MSVYYIEHTRNKLTGTSRVVRKWPDANATIDQVIDAVALGGTYGGGQFVQQQGQLKWHKPRDRPVLKTLLNHLNEVVDGVTYPYVTIGERRDNTVRFDVQIVSPNRMHVEHFITFFETVELA